MLSLVPKPIRLSSGFTLIELAIVITVISLIIAGIISGRSIVRNATIHRVTSDIHKFEIAVNTFRDQYQALPGDMINATDYWSTASIGDGGNSWNPWQYDGVYAWQHMTYAGILNFPYLTGNAAGGNGPTNCPTVDYIASGGFHFTSAGILGFGGYMTGGRYVAGVFTGRELARIDAKYDDGTPRLGKITGNYAGTSAGGWSCTCASSCDGSGQAAAGATYPATDDIVCWLAKRIIDVTL